VFTCGGLVRQATAEAAEWSSSSSCCNVGRSDTGASTNDGQTSSVVKRATPPFFSISCMKRVSRVESKS